MQADLHFYSTYVAGMAAGFSAAQAIDIALAAHYVDCSGDPNPLPDPETGEILEDTIGPVRMLYSAKKGLADTRVRDIWAAFHFLPSLNEKVDARYKYAWDNIYRPAPDSLHGMEPQSVLSEIDISDAKRQSVLLNAIPADERALLKWRCFPYSAAVTAMRQHLMAQVSTIKRAGNTDLALALIGVRLHVLADTFSHAGCSAPKGKGNHYDGISIKAPGEAARTHLVDVGNGDKWLPLNFVMLARSPVNYAAIGHSTYGALPDFPGISWRTTATGWDEGTIYRRNPVVYKNAIAEIYRWLVDAYFAFTGSRNRSTLPTVVPAKRLMYELDFDKGVFTYPRNYLNLCARNRDFYSYHSQRYHEFKGQSESDLYLEERCKYLRGKIETDIIEWINHVPIEFQPAIDLAVDHGLTDYEKKHNLGESMAGWKINTSKYTWDAAVDNGTEYRIIRRVRKEYYNHPAKLRTVNSAVRLHKKWFKEDLLPLLT